MSLWPREPSERRLKQHVQAPAHAWYASCFPGVERLLLDELSSLGIPGGSTVPGGVEFEARLDDMMRVQLHGRLSSHIRLRLASFRAPNPLALVDRLQALPWDLWIRAGYGIRIEGADGMPAAFRRVLAEFQTAFPVSEPVAGLQGLMARCRDGEWQLSLEASGDPLHRRGYRLETGRAPLRETMAAALLDLVQYDGSRLLVDPMAGSGTIALEAARRGAGVAAGIDRTFAFEDWPGHREATWQHLKRKASEEMSAAPEDFRVLAREVSRRILQGAEANATRARVREWVRFEQADFFEALPPPGEPGWVVFNPPYGQRIGMPGGARDGLEAIARRLTEVWSGWRIGLVTPDPAGLVRAGLKIDHQILVPHGGLEVSLIAAHVRAVV